MKFILYLFLAINGLAHARTQTNCEVVDGFYRNSSETIQDLKFETVVDIFSISNAQTLTFNLEGENLKLLRSSIDVKKQTKMIYLFKKNDQVMRAALLTLDRTPREAAKTKEYYGVMILTSSVSKNEIALGNYSSQDLVYNFYCRF